MLRAISICVAVAFGASTLTGCIVDRRPRRTVVVKEKRGKRGGCPPAHHWNGRACVHNGKHKGHRHKR